MIVLAPKFARNEVTVNYMLIVSLHVHKTCQLFSPPLVLFFFMYKHTVKVGTHL